MTKKIIYKILEKWKSGLLIKYKNIALLKNVSIYKKRQENRFATSVSVEINQITNKQNFNNIKKATIEITNLKASSLRDAMISARSEDPFWYFLLPWR